MSNKRIYIAAAAAAALVPLGLLLHTIVSPVILGFIFFGCIVPIGFLMRQFGNDPLKRRFEPETRSYWLVREPPGPTPESFKRQY